MPSSKSLPTGPDPRSWISKSTWCERIITFDPSWFVLTMGTGIIVQLLNYFPWPAHWLMSLGYVFWILDIVMFGFFSILGCLRLFMYPKVAASIIDDFSQTSFLGAIPISWDAITAGIALYYHTNTGALYVAQVFYWISVVLTTAVSIGGVFAMYKRQGQHQLNEVTGVWLLTFIPMIATAALGSSLVSYLSGNNAATVLFVSFFMLSLGLGLSFIIMTIYFWRLMACNLPARDAVVSCFVPVGPLSFGAFAITGLSTGLSKLIVTNHFVFQESWTSPYDPVSHAAVGQMIIWIGVISALLLLGVATFFLIEAFVSVFSKVPKSFNIGLWSVVFPCGVYANAFCRLSTTLQNNGMRGWAAAWVVITILLWLTLAILTTYKGVWQGKTFTAPGLQGHVEQQRLDNLNKTPDDAQDGRSSNADSSTTARILNEKVDWQTSSDGTFRRVPSQGKENGSNNV